jgi:glutathione S-transferase
MALLWVGQYTNLNVELREVELKRKPAEMLSASPKGTVPVLVLPDNRVIDESRDIMAWVLAFDDSESLQTHLAQQLTLIDRNDLEFKHWLDRYKYAVGYPEKSQQEYRDLAEPFLAELEARLEHHAFLYADKARLADLAIFPFVRQFAFVDKAWFDSAPYPRVQRWLAYWLEHPLFERAMQKFEPWQAGDTPVYWP